MAQLNKQKTTPNGAELAMAAAAALGDSFHNTGAERVVFANASGGPITVTVDTPNPDNFGISGNALDQTVTVPAGATRFVAGPFATHRHNDPNGNVQMTYSAVAGLTVGVIA